MGVREMTAQQLYEKAVKDVEEGRLERAVKLLQIAVIKAPQEAILRETLQQVKTMLEEGATLADGGEEDGPGEGDEGGEAEEPSPEAFYLNAMELIEEGTLDRAAQLLQVAVAQAPGEAKYRDALKDVRARRSGQSARKVVGDVEQQARLHIAIKEKQFDEAEGMLRDLLRDDRANPETQFQLALVMFKGKGQEKDALTPAQEAVRLAPDRADALVLLGKIQTALGQDGPAAETQAKVDAIANERQGDVDLAVMKVAEFNRTGVTAVEVPEYVGRPDSTSIWKRVGLVVMLLVMLGMTGAMYWIRQPVVIDVGVYSGVLPVSEALAMPKRTELMLRVPEADWAKLAVSDRHDVMSKLFQEAAGQGYEAVFLETTSSHRLLATINADATYLQ